jgi:SPP1 family predicted phage head-tail adaptor
MVPGMNGGRWRRVDLQSVAFTQNSLKENIPAYTTEATVWAQLRPLSGRESFIAQQVNADVTHEIIIRYYSGLTPKHRILFGTRQFDIISVLNKDERNEYQVITASEATNG